MKAGLGADRNLFLTMRQRGMCLKSRFLNQNALNVTALKNGNPASVKKMFQLLKPWAGLLDYPDSKLKNQLQNEYNIDVDRVTAQPEAISSIELNAVHKLSGTTRTLT
jgi:hypothetical protein